MTREELKQIYYINKEIKMWQRELDRLQCKSLIGSQQIDGMPKGSGASDKVADLAIEKEEIREIINGKLTEIQVQRKRIMNYINGIEDSLLRQIVYLRNVSCMNWKQVARELNSTENCVKQIYSRHFRKGGLDESKAKKKNYKKIHGCNPPKPVDYDSVINSIVEVMPGTISALEKMIKDVISETNKLINNIKEMPEEEFNEKILCSELTLEQIAMAKTIRYGNGKSK